VDVPPKDARAADKAVTSLQERLADGDPTDTTLRSQCENPLLTLCAAYRAHPAAFSREAIKALREVNGLLRETDPAANVDAPDKTRGQE
jgi:hypothetical protein